MKKIYLAIPVIIAIAMLMIFVYLSSRPAPPTETMHPIPSIEVSTSTVPKKVITPKETQGQISNATSTKHIAEPPVFEQPTSDAITDASSILALVNNARIKAGLPRLKRNSLLDTAAQAKANDEATKGYFAHVSPVDGKDYVFFLQQVGYSCHSNTGPCAGENLGEGYTTASDLVQAWINSPTHYANIVAANYTETGIGIAQGKYQGYMTTFVVEDFGQM